MYKCITNKYYRKVYATFYTYDSDIVKLSIIKILESMLL